MFSLKTINHFHVGESKNIQKSVRFHPLVYEYIMSYRGDNFSDKLENIVVDHATLNNYKM